MKKNCEQFLENILTPEEPLSSESIKHLKKCSECQMLRRDVMTFAPPCPNDKLNQKIIRQTNQRHHYWRWASLAAAASIFAVVAVNIITEKEPTATPKKSNISNISFELSSLEEATYNLDYDINSCNYAINNF